MGISSHAIANKFIKLAENSGKPLTNMQLQKLVFLSQGYSLALLGRQIYYHNTHAWQFGPVVPKLYKSLQKYGRSFVNEELQTDDQVIDPSQELDVIEAVWEVYGHMTGNQLSTLTHKDGTPWSVTWKSSQFGVIPESVISEHYKSIVESA